MNVPCQITRDDGSDLPVPCLMGCEEIVFPMAHGYMQRCRFVSEEALSRLYPGIPLRHVTHDMPAIELLQALPVIPEMEQLKRDLLAGRHGPQT